jgi:hypothetical protein
VTATAVLDVVVLADESGSETSATLADERQTAATIAQTMLNPASRVTVVGFGGINHVAAGQSPVDVACQPTIASGANLGYLASCVTKLHRRTEAEGDDTDYAAALGQALSYFDPDTAFGRQSPRGAVKIILMMTDGGIDVHRDTQHYGPNWQLGEQEAVDQHLALARQYGAQVWPLGFGTDIMPEDASYLNRLAQGGARVGCDSRPVSEPHYQVVRRSSDALDALDALYAEAGCLGTSATAPVTVGRGQSDTLPVAIPSIASAAAISVDRGDPGVQVSYYRPDGRQWTDASAISGQGSPVEVLHLADVTGAETGTWKIRLTTAPALAGQPVSAIVFWQGAVRALITADPPNAKPGQSIDLTLSVLGPNGPVTDSSTLAKLQVRVGVSGDGLTGTAPVPVTSLIGKPAAAGAVGEYRGSFTAPRQAGTLTFFGTAAGYGLYVTQVPANVQVSAAGADFGVTIRPQVADSVQAGHAIHGQIGFVNQAGAGRSVRLRLDVSHAIAHLTTPVGPLVARPGGPPEVPYTVTFGKDSPTGEAWLEIEVVDAADPSIVYSEIQLEVGVTRAQSILARWLPEVTGLVFLTVLAWFWLSASRRKKVNAHGLIAILRRDGEQLGRELRALSAWSRTFRFIIHDEEGQAAELRYPEMGGRTYTASRAGGREVKLMTPDGERYDIIVGGAGRKLDHNGLELAFKDIRGKRATLRLPHTSTGWRRRDRPSQLIRLPGEQEPAIKLLGAPTHPDQPI